MPNIAAEAKPVLFGDFSYFWIVDRSPVSMKALKECFAMTDRVGTWLSSCSTPVSSAGTP